MRVQMRGTHRGSPDGINVESYDEGKHYDLPSDLAEVFVREGWAVAVEAPPAAAQEPATAKVTAVVTPGETKVVTPEERKDDTSGGAPQGEATDEVTPDLTILEYSPEDAKELIASLTDPHELRDLRAGEAKNEDFTGGRPLVLAAIDERLAALTAQA